MFNDFEELKSCTWRFSYTRNYLKKTYAHRKHTPQFFSRWPTLAYNFFMHCQCEKNQRMCFAFRRTSKSKRHLTKFMHSFHFYCLAQKIILTMINKCLMYAAYNLFISMPSPRRMIDYCIRCECECIESELITNKTINAAHHLLKLTFATVKFFGPRLTHFIFSQLNRFFITFLNTSGV